MSTSPGSRDSRGLRRGRLHAVMPDDSCSLLVDRRGDMGPGHFTCPISPEEVAERDAITAVCRPPWLRPDQTRLPPTPLPGTEGSRCKPINRKASA